MQLNTKLKKNLIIHNQFADQIVDIPSRSNKDATYFLHNMAFTLIYVGPSVNEVKMPIDYLLPIKVIECTRYNVHDSLSHAT